MTKRKARFLKALKVLKKLVTLGLAAEGAVRQVKR